jgi:ABC-type glutathione transport system ATPase component
VWIALATRAAWDIAHHHPHLVQVLLLDELTTYLDPEDQQGVLDAVRASVYGPERVTAIWVRLLPLSLTAERAYILNERVALSTRR